MKKILILSHPVAKSDWAIVEKAIFEEGAASYMLCHDFLRCRAPQRIKDKISLLDGLIGEDEYREINDASLAFSTTWFTTEPLAGALSYNGLNFGKILEVPVYNYVNALFRINLILLRLLEAENPDEICVFFQEWEPSNWVVEDDEPLLERLAIAIAEHKGIKTTIMKPATAVAGRFWNNAVWTLRDLKRKSLVVKSKLKKKDRGGEPEVTGQSPVQAPVAFVRSSHSVIEIAAAYSRLGFGQAFYVGLNQGQTPLGGGKKLPEVAFIDLYSYVPLILPAHAKTYLSDLVTLLQQDRVLSSLGYSCRCERYLIDLFRSTFINYLKTDGCWVLRYIEGAERILSRFKFESIFADGCQQIIERIFFLLGSKRRCLTIETAHSLCNNVFELAFPEYFITDYFFVWGKHDRKLMEQLGGRPEMLEEVGVGRFSGYLSCVRKSDDNGFGKVRVGITCDKEYKFYGRTGFGNMRGEIHLKRYTKLIELAKNDKNIILSFKLRPGIETDFYLLDMLERSKIENYEVFQDITVPEWMPSLSMLITDYSTMGLEAMIFDVPVLIHRSDAVHDPLGYESSGAVDVIDPELDNLQELICSISRDPGCRSRQRAEFVISAIGDLGEMCPSEKTAVVINDKNKLARTAAA